MEKITKKEKFAAIVEILNAAENANIPSTIDYDTLRKFVESEQQLLANRAASAARRAANIKAESNKIRERVYSVVTDEWEIAEHFTDLIDDPDITLSVVIARLKQLEDAGRVEKTTVEVETVTGKIKKHSAYRRTQM